MGNFPKQLTVAKRFVKRFRILNMHLKRRRRLQYPKVIYVYSYIMPWKDGNKYKELEVMYHICQKVHIYFTQRLNICGINGIKISK